MSEERLSDPNEESAAIDPPGNTGPEASANLDATNADGEVAIDPPGNT